MPSEDLHRLLTTINRTIGSLREDVQTLTGEVKKIHTAINEAAKTIRDAIQENIQAQAELKLMEHVMEVRSIKPQIEAERDQIETEREELDERLTQIEQRYQEKQSELDGKANERIRNLGSHIFEIHEQEFENGIEEPFTEHVTATWQVLQSHNTEVRDERTETIRDTTGEAVETIHNYIDRQTELISDIRRHRLDADRTPLPTENETKLQVPYYIVEYEHNGTTTQQLIVPSRLERRGRLGGEWSQVSLSPIENADDLLKGVDSIDNPTRSETISETDITRSLSSYGESSLGISYIDAVADALPSNGRVPVEVAEGDD